MRRLPLPAARCSCERRARWHVLFVCARKLRAVGANGREIRRSRGVPSGWRLDGSVDRHHHGGVALHADKTSHQAHGLHKDASTTNAPTCEYRTEPSARFSGRNSAACGRRFSAALPSNRLPSPAVGLTHDIHSHDPIRPCGITRGVQSSAKLSHQDLFGSTRHLRPVPRLHR